MKNLAVPKSESRVESFFLSRAPVGFLPRSVERTAVLTVDNYVTLGQLTALRFLEWISLNPEGVVALPTGKTPEFFIKWVMHLREHWSHEARKGIVAACGLSKARKPDLRGLRFVQLDEFFPISPQHDRSFARFVRRFYIDGFGLDARKALLIDTYTVDENRRRILGSVDNVQSVFPDGVIDLSLRTRQPSSRSEELQKRTIKLFDQFCEDYELRIRAMGGIGFFLGGIGPDGHIAFNVRGSSHHSHTRLTGINYETQAVAAADLGGIESVRKKAVITIGLGTITFNADVTAIIIAAGESKAGVVADAVEKAPALEYPATCLQQLPNARFFLTQGAASQLTERNRAILRAGEAPNPAAISRLVVDGSWECGLSLAALSRGGKYMPCERLSLAHQVGRTSVASLSQQTHEEIARKIERGIHLPKNDTFLHTGPHHDDIELAYFPLLHHLVRSEHNQNHFCYCTSGFTAVTNAYVRERLSQLAALLRTNTLGYTDTAPPRSDADGQSDITGYLRGIAQQDAETCALFVARRLARCLSGSSQAECKGTLLQMVEALMAQLATIDPGQADPTPIQQIKAWIRQFEAELVWAHFGIGMDRVHHLGLQFYSGDIFPEYPHAKRDVQPIVALLEKIRPTIITLAMDPEASGPDTHFKTLIALEQAIARYMKAHPDAPLRVWGYRNVWSRFHPSDVSMIVPVSLNSFAVLHNMFNSCFLSQKSASFPSHEFDGTFSQMAQKIWVNQHDDLVRLMGRDYFYDHPHPMMRRSYGAIYIRDMSYAEFRTAMEPVRALLESGRSTVMGKDVGGG